MIDYRCRGTAAFGWRLWPPLCSWRSLCSQHFGPIDYDHCDKVLHSGSSGTGFGWNCIWTEHLGKQTQPASWMLMFHPTTNMSSWSFVVPPHCSFVARNFVYFSAIAMASQSSGGTCLLEPTRVQLWFAGWLFGQTFDSAISTQSGRVANLSASLVG